MKPGDAIDKAVTAACSLAGVACVTFGLWQLAPPLAWIFSGGVCLYVAGGQPTPEAPKK